MPLIWRTSTPLFTVQPWLENMVSFGSPTRMTTGVLGLFLDGGGCQGLYSQGDRVDNSCLFFRACVYCILENRKSVVDLFDSYCILENRNPVADLFDSTFPLFLFLTITGAIGNRGITKERLGAGDGEEGLNFGIFRNHFRAPHARLTRTVYSNQSYHWPPLYGSLYFMGMQNLLAITKNPPTSLTWILVSLKAICKQKSDVDGKLIEVVVY